MMTMTKNLQDTPRIEPREERGYAIIGITGIVDDDIHRQYRSEDKSFLDAFRDYSSSLGRPFVLDLTECKLHGSGSLSLFLEAYSILGDKVPVVSNDDHLSMILRNTRIDDFTTMHRSIEDLPELPKPISSR